MDRSSKLYVKRVALPSKQKGNMSSNIQQAFDNSSNIPEVSQDQDDYSTLMNISIDTNISKLSDNVLDASPWISHPNLTIKRFQADAIEAYKRYDLQNGYFSMASSSGKTFMIFLLLKEEIKKLRQTKSFIVITSSDYLVTQLSFKITNFCRKERVLHKIYPITSESRVIDLPNIISSNSIIITTYSSCVNDIIQSHKLHNKIHTIILDEAHNICLYKSKRKFVPNEIKKDKIKRIYLTSTPVKSTHEYSMDNESIFGKCIYEYTCATAINNESINKWINIQISTSDIQEQMELYQLDNIKRYYKSKIFNFLLSFSKLSIKHLLDNNINSVVVYVKTKKQIKIMNYCYKFWFLQNNINNKIIKLYSEEEVNNNINIHIDNFKSQFDGIKILITNNINEGVEISNCNCVIFAIPKQSQPIIAQNIGRCIRKTDDYKSYIIYPECLIHDDKSISKITFDNIKQVSNLLLNTTTNLMFTI
jgi:superfamily II DNA or RNA helicase